MVSFRNKEVFFAAFLVLVSLSVFVFSLTSSPLLVSPSDGFWNNSDNDTQEFVFNFTDPDNSSADCVLYMNGVAAWSGNVTNATNTGVYSNQTFNENANTWYVNCTNTTTTTSVTWTLNIDTGIPSTTTPIITPSTAFTNDDLECNATLIDSLRTSLTAYYIWYKDDVINITGSVAVTNGTNASLILGSGNITKGENWICEITPNDGLNNGTAINSTARTVSNSIPVIGSPSLNDTIPATSDMLLCTNGSYTDADSDSATWHYRWYDGGVLISGQTSSTLDLTVAGLNKGDIVKCSTTADDGTSNATAWTNSSDATIQNSAPTTTTPTLSPGTVYKITTPVTCNNASVSDIDDDSVTWYYQWHVNNVTSVTTQNITNTSYSKGDQLICEIWADDGVVNSTKYNSTTLSVLNSIPVIGSPSLNDTTPETSDTLLCINGSVSDIDGDSFTWYYLWYDGGVLISGQTSSTLDLTVAGLNKGDLVKCSTIADDGTSNATAWTNSSDATIQNSVPTTTTPTLSPGTVYKITTPVTCNNGSVSDIDDDSVTWYYQWHVNNVTSVITQNITNTSYSKGDQLICEIWAFDGSSNSTKYNSTTLIVSNSIPVIGSPSLNDTTPATSDMLLCTNGSFSDVDSDSATWHYRWYDGGVLISGQTSSTLDLTLANLDKGDIVKCSTIADDGTLNATAWTNSSDATIQNTASTTTTPTLSPGTVYKITTPVTCNNGSVSDIDDDSVTWYYQWHVNNVTSVITQNITNTSYSKGDQLICEIWAFDGSSNSTKYNSTTLTVSNSVPTTTTPTLDPTTVYQNTSQVTCNNASVFDADGDSVTWYYQWYINGVQDIVVQSITNVSYSNGDQLICEIWAYDGAVNSTKINSSPVTVANTAPTTTTPTLSPGTVYKTTTPVTCNNGSVSDLEGDPITWYYQWYVNNVTNVTTQNITNTSYTKDDQLICEIWADDGDVNSTKYNSTTLTVSNSAPTIVSVFVNVSYAKAGDDVLITSSTAYDIDGDNVALLCGNSSGNYNLGIGTYGSPERNMSFVFSWSDDSLHTIYCILSDIQAENSTEVNVNITADNTPPSVIDFDVNDTDKIVMSTDSLNITVTVTDSGSTNLSVSVNGTIMSNISGNVFSTINTTADFGCVVSGPCTLAVTATDGVGNLNTSEYIVITVDNENPSLVIYPMPNYISGSVIKVNGTYFDLNNITASIVVNDTNFGSMQGTLDSWFFQNVTNVSDGIYTVEITANDSVGNVNVSTVTFTVDNTAPSFNGPMPAIALKADGTDTAYSTNLSYYFNGSTVKLRVNLTEQYFLSLKANFSMIDGNNTLVDAVDNGDGTYNITYILENVSGFAAGPVIIIATDLAGNFKNDISFTAVMNINPIWIDPSLGGATTDWTTIADFTNISSLTFEKLSFGKIVFTDVVDVTDNITVSVLQDLGNNLYIENANISLNSAVGALAALNKSANITMFNLTGFDSSTSPGILMDGILAVSTNQTSGGTVSDVVWIYPNLTFSVSEWTSYYADGDAPVTTDNSSSSWMNANQTISLNCTDFSGSGCDTTMYNINGSGWNIYSSAFDVVSEGNSTLEFFSNDTLNNTETVKTAYILIDKTNPSIISFGLSASTVYIGDTVTGTCTANDSIDSSVSTSITGIDTSSSGTKTVTCTATDDAGNYVQSSTNLEVNSRPSSGGGGYSTLPSDSNTVFWSKVTPGVATIMKITNEDIGLSEISIEVNNPANNVKITVEKLESKPASITKSVSGNVYRYLKIDKTNIENEDIKSAQISFRIEKSWFDDNNFDKNTAVLNRYENGWQKLKTDMLSNDSIYVYYVAETTGFSYFSISAESSVDDTEDAVTGPTTDEDLVEMPVETEAVDAPSNNGSFETSGADDPLGQQATGDLSETQRPYRLYIILLIVTLFLVGSVAYILHTNNKSHKSLQSDILVEKHLSKKHHK